MTSEIKFNIVPCHTGPCLNPVPSLHWLTRCDTVVSGGLAPKKMNAFPQKFASSPLFQPHLQKGLTSTLTR